MGVATGCGCNFLILLIPTPLLSVLFYSSIPTFCSFFSMFFNYTAEQADVPQLLNNHF